ncbi:hypothetical protein BEI_3567 [Halomonas beimenensis]|uniref:Uncharacterized protein n=1 Tax=Halomonas beimenensis TaxID=475662 RepID=A0A291PCC1_9GAMM|nr:hypothetical protein BEI_3567 [Halomonas beimenensis]
MVPAMAEPLVEAAAGDDRSSRPMAVGSDRLRGALTVPI